MIKILLIKIFSLTFLSLLFSGNVYSLPKCEGADINNWSNCNGLFYYPDKRYSGEWMNGKREGQGISNLNDGSSYEGEWKNDKPNGKGSSKIPYAYYNVEFVGKWNDGKPNGQGVLKCFPEGRKKTSEWSTKKYEGEWKDGYLKIKNDDGNQSYVSSETCATFTGEVINGGAHGKGEMTYPHGQKYSGEWKNDKFLNGTLIFYNGTKFTGEFKDGRPDGSGTMINPDGSKVVGQFKNGYPKKATQIFIDGSKYIGEWKGNKSQGQGTMTYSNGSKYVGQWLNSNKHGQGTFTTNEGIIYSGEWENDKLNGEATITLPEGNTVKGLFKNGKFIKEIKDL